MTGHAKVIGGFFPIAVEFKKTRRNFLSLWGDGLLFHNARSGLHYVLRHTTIRKLWLPAYICTDLLDAVYGTAAFDFYPVDSTLSPDISFLQSHIAAGEAVLVVDYFGRPPSADFLTFAKDRNDICWIEDCAQAIYPAKKSYGDFMIYSPRKVFGVPDGGVVVAVGTVLPQPAYQRLASADFAAAPLMRFEDQGESGNWYGLFREYEDNMGVSLLPMSRISYEILTSTDPLPIIKQRRRNYKILHEQLRHIALFNDFPADFAPFGFPIVVEQRDALLAALHNHHIFAACHWKDIPADRNIFAWEHSLAASIITLPCDQRYSEKDMEHIAAFILGYPNHAN